jgi:hypothetical protein
VVKARTSYSSTKAVRDVTFLVNLLSDLHLRTAAVACTRWRGLALRAVCVCVLFAVDGVSPAQASVQDFRFSLVKNHSTAPHSRSCVVPRWTKGRSSADTRSNPHRKNTRCSFTEKQHLILKRGNDA